MAEKRGRRGSHPNASNWDKIRGKDLGDTLANRDVYEDQQLDRSKINPLLTKTSRNIVAAIAGVLVAVFMWCAVSFIMVGVSSAGGFFDGLSDSGDGSSGSSVQPYYSDCSIIDDGVKQLLCSQCRWFRWRRRRGQVPYWPYTR